MNNANRLGPEPTSSISRLERVVEVADAAPYQAFRMVDLCQKTFQRALRQLANVRLVRAKTNRMKRRERARAIKAIKVA